MPTYDYECNACEHRFELFQSISEKPRRKCPRCGRNRAQRMIGAGGAIIFKGSGFYATDYRSKEFHDRKKQESKEETPSGGTEPSGSKDAEHAKSKS